MATLYRQYRPIRFNEVMGQKHVTDTLQRALNQNRTAHAYIFYGPRGTGKTTTARILAQRLNCTKAKDAEPCGRCPQCVASTNSQNIDIIEIDAASNRGIDDIRALQETINLSPAMSRHKVYIIDEVHMLTREAASALLKTLEEPVKHAVFILATTELHKVPDTIISRCQVYRFRRATHDEMKQRIEHILKQEKRRADKEAIEFIIARSDGCYRDAESLLGQLLSLHAKKVTVDNITEALGLPPKELIEKFVSSLIADDSSSAITAADEGFAGGFDPEQFLSEAILLSREVALAIIDDKKTAVNINDKTSGLIRLPIILRALLQAIQDLAFVPQPLLAIHLVILSVCQPNKTSDSPRRVHSYQPDKKSTIINTSTLTIKPTANGSTAVSFGLPDVKKVWPKLIEHVRSTNPVAATFLRAMQPMSVRGANITIQAHYTLHHNFFNKTINNKPIQDELSKLLNQEVLISCVISDQNQSPGSNKSHQEQELVSAVKEVFGIAPSQA